MSPGSHTFDMFADFDRRAAMRSVEYLRYSEEPPEDWRLAPINFGSRIDTYNQHIARIVRTIGKSEWDLLISLRASNVLSAKDFFTRIYGCIDLRTRDTTFRPGCRHLNTGQFELSLIDSLPVLPDLPNFDSDAEKGL